MKRTSRRINSAMVKEIKHLLELDTLFQHQIAAIYGINQGRVSEIKNGHYD